MSPTTASTSSDQQPPKTSGGWRKRLAFVVLLVVAAILVASFDLRTLRETLTWIEQRGLWGQVLFVALCVMAALLLIPGSIFGLSAGAMFGVVRGSLLASLSSILGATCAFLLGRYLARGWVARKIEGNAAFSAIDQAVAGQGWRIVLLTRLSPVFPFALLNYGFSVTRVSLRDYVLFSWIGMMPATVLYAYLGSLVRAGVADRKRTPAEWALYAIGLLATIAVVVIATRIARRALAKRTTSVS